MLSRILPIALCVASVVAPVSAQTNVPATSAPNSGPRPAEEYFYKQRSYPFGRIPQDARLRALDQARDMATRGSKSGLHSAQSWRVIGPFNTGGRVNSIAVHPLNGDTLWIGAADGGVWKSTNAGVSWRPVMDNANSLALGAVAVDPEHPSVVYAGTGEAAFNIDSYAGAGMYKSTDGGETWRESGLSTVAAFSRIVVLPGSSTVIASAIRNNGGIYRSTDGGASWSRIVGEQVYDLTVNPSNADEIVAAAGSSAILRSTDRGLTFSPSASGIAPDGSYPGRLSIQYAPSDPSILYALSAEWIPPNDNISRIYKSTDGGSSWTMQLDNQPNLLNYYGFAQGAYNNVITVNPTNPDIAFAGGVVLVRTTDGGLSWDIIAPNVHVDFHALTFDKANPDRLYVGTDGGMYAGTGDGEVFERISSGLAITQFYGMGIDQRMPDVTYGGTQDNGTISTIAGEFAFGAPGILNGSDGFDVAVDHTNSDIVYGEQPYGAPFRVDLRTANPQRFANGLDFNETANWSAPLVMNPLSANVLYLGRSSVYRFNPPENRWRSMSTKFASTLLAIGVSPADTSIVYAGSERGELRVTTNAGATWQDISLARGLPDRAITDIAPSPVNECTALISYSGFYSGHVFITRDCGATWSDISRGLPDVPVNALVIDPNDTNVVFAGTDIGVFTTTDAGLTWWKLGDGMPAVVVADLDLHRQSRTLRAATHGRSMYEIAIGDIAHERAIVTPAGGDRWVGQTVRSIVWNAFDEPVRLEYSIDDGARWQQIDAAVIGGAYQWKIPDIASSVARVRATSTADSTRRVVSAAFTIEPLRPGIVIGTAQKPVNCHGLAFDGVALWASSEFGDTLVKIDPTTLSTIDFIRIRGLKEGELLNDIAFHPQRGTLFAHGLDDRNPQEPAHGSLLEIDRDGMIINRWTSPCVYPLGITMIDDPMSGPSLLVSDLFDDQSWYVIDDESGAVIRKIAREDFAQYGPNGMATGETPGTFWQVIADFSLDHGPRGSTAVLMSLSDQSPACVFNLATTRDSTAVIGQWNWGRLFARGIERDPRDNGFWVTNLDGTIFKITGCETSVSSSPEHNEASIGFAVGRPAPNPAGSFTLVEVECKTTSEVLVELRNAAGQLVRQQYASDVVAGASSIRIDLHGLASGVYSLSVSNGRTTLSHQLVKIE